MYFSRANMYPNVNVLPTMQQPIMQQPVGPNYPPTMVSPYQYYPQPHPIMPTNISPAHYEQINIYTHAPKKHIHHCIDYSSTAIILVLYILLVIILRSVC